MEGFKNPHVAERDRLLSRIDNGDNKEHPFIDSLFYESTIETSAFEAGKDECLRCLKEEGEYLDASKAPYGYVFNHLLQLKSISKDFKGYLVFIAEGRTEGAEE